MLEKESIAHYFAVLVLHYGSIRIIYTVIYKGDLENFRSHGIFNLFGFIIIQCTL